MYILCLAVSVHFVLSFSLSLLDGQTFQSYSGPGHYSKKSSGRSTSSPLIARCAEEVNDIVLEQICFTITI